MEVRTNPFAVTMVHAANTKAMKWEDIFAAKVLTAPRNHKNTPEKLKRNQLNIHVLCSGYNQIPTYAPDKLFEWTIP